tara:strand:+ start:150 stop:359 length:210 start_codon:yes stop_codon:yes gene_type:complete
MARAPKGGPLKRSKEAEEKERKNEDTPRDEVHSPFAKDEASHHEAFVLLSKESQQHHSESMGHHLGLHA